MQQDSCSSFQTNLHALERVWLPLLTFLPLSFDTEGSDGAEGMSLLLCLHTQQELEVGCLMLRVN